MSDFIADFEKMNTAFEKSAQLLQGLLVENVKLKEEIKKRDELLETVLVNLKAFNINTPNIHSFLVVAIGSILGADKEKS